jgi:hypothetical protein
LKVETPFSYSRLKTPSVRCYGCKTIGRVRIDVGDLVSAQGEAHRRSQVQERQGRAGVGVSTKGNYLKFNRL